MHSPLVLYSANTWLAYMIAQRYYGQIHYAWCTPDFDPRSLAFTDASVPPTSSPLEVYRNLAEEVRRGDLHSAKIKENKVGVLRGATAKYAQGKIGDDQRKEIAEIVDAVQTRDFRPLLYVIPYAGIADLVNEVPVKDRAHPLSAEYIIEELPRDRFDVIEF